MVDIELTPRDRAIIHENYQAVQQQVNEVEKIVAEINRNNPVSQFILGAVNGIKDNLVGTAAMAAHPLETLQTIKEAVTALSQLSADDIAKIATLLKEKGVTLLTTKDGINSIPYGAGYVVGTVATDIVVGKGAGIALEGLKEIKAIPTNAAVKTVTLTTGEQLKFPSVELTKLSDLVSLMKSSDESLTMLKNGSTAGES